MVYPWNFSEGILRASFEVPGESHPHPRSPYFTSPGCPPPVPETSAGAEGPRSQGLCDLRQSIKCLRASVSSRTACLSGDWQVKMRNSCGGCSDQAKHEINVRPAQLPPGPDLVEVRIPLLGVGSRWASEGDRTSPLPRLPKGQLCFVASGGLHAALGCGHNAVA